MSIVETGILPVDGGWEGQSSAFEAMLKIVSGARARHEERLRLADEEAQAKASAEQRAAEERQHDGDRDGTQDP